MRRLEKSFRVMKEQSMRNLTTSNSTATGGQSSTSNTAASPWVRLRALETLEEGLDEIEEEGDEEESSQEPQSEKGSEKGATQSN